MEIETNIKANIAEYLKQCTSEGFGRDDIETMLIELISEATDNRLELSR
jgi:hypothetical protein